MARRYHPRSTVGDNLRVIVQRIPWKLLFLLPMLIVLAVPTYVYGARIGSRLLPSMTSFFYTLGEAAPTPAPTPYPAFSPVLPQSGSILYTVQGGDSCDEILAIQMRMARAGEIFSDVNPNTVQALNQTLGQDCHHIQPGMVLPLLPHYPLMTLGGVVTKIEASTPQQVLPTPLINVPNQSPLNVDCSGGCSLLVRIATGVQVHLQVQTTLALKVGSWVWAQATMPRKAIAKFDDYPYVDPTASLDGATLRACDFQVDNTHDDNSLSCDQLVPNTIDDDGGSWLLGVTGTNALGHWGYHLGMHPNIRVLIWLSFVNGTLKYKPGNPIYKYDDQAHIYVKA